MFLQHDAYLQCTLSIGNVWEVPCQYVFMVSQNTVFGDHMPVTLWQLHCMLENCVSFVRRSFQVLTAGPQYGPLPASAMLPGLGL